MDNVIEKGGKGGACVTTKLGQISREEIRKKNTGREEVIQKRCQGKRQMRLKVKKNNAIDDIETVEQEPDLPN